MKNIFMCFLLTLTACVNPINQKTANNYYLAAEKSLYNGDYPHALEMYKRALVNVRLGHLGYESEAKVFAALGRTYGNMCMHIEAEESFTNAVSLLDKAHGLNNYLTFPTRLELAQFAYDVGWYDKSVSYYQEALPIGQRQLASIDPLGFSNVMKDYSDALKRTGDEMQSLAVMKLALEQESKVVVQKLTESEYIRYPKVCD